MRAKIRKGANREIPIAHLKPERKFIISKKDISSRSHKVNIAGVGELIKEVKGSRKRPGFDEILIPGEPEARITKKRTQEGIEIPQKLFDSIRDVAATLDIDAEQYLD